MHASPEIPGHEPVIVPDVLFTTVAALFRQLGAVRSSGDIDTDCLTVGKVSPAEFRAIQAARERDGRRFRFFYRPQVACLVITITTGRHEQAHGCLYRLVENAIIAMGLYNQWKPHYATEYAALGGASAEGDSSGGPRWRASRYNSQMWPTLVIEAAASQSLPALRAKAQWWFAASNYHMNVVILVKLFSTASVISRMEIEQWVATTGASGPQRPGATTRQANRAAATSKPEMTQQLSIHWSGPAPFHQTPLGQRALADFRVTGAPLVIRFQGVMERPPMLADGERDIIIAEADLQDVAMRVWEEGD